MTDEEKVSNGSLLIVDDNMENLKALLGLLQGRDFEVAIARSGEEALLRAALLLPELILLDVMMPGMNGFETCRRLKAEEVTREIPVIFMTALADVDSKIKGFEAGGVDYVTKPLEYREVMARLTTHLGLYRLQRDLAERNTQLQAALDRVKQLSGLLPICANCKKIRNDEGYWQEVALYISQHSEAEFTHGICPDCMQQLYPEYYHRP